MAVGPVEIVISGGAGQAGGARGVESTVYGSGSEAMEAINGRYEVVSVGVSDNDAESGQEQSAGPHLYIELKKPGHDTAYEKWMQHYKEETGGEVSFF